MKKMLVAEVDGYVGVLYTDETLHIRYVKREKFCDFIQFIHKRHPQYQMEFVRNEGVEIAVRKKIREDLKKYMNRKAIIRD